MAVGYRKPILGEPVPGRHPAPGRRGALAAALPAVLVFSAVRALSVLVLHAWASVSDTTAHHLLSRRWDSLWYARVVEHGYDFTLHAPDGRNLSNLSFFPLFPGLEALVSRITGLAPADAGLLVSNLSSLVAAWGIFALVGSLYGSRVAGITVVIWAGLPVSNVLSMAYSESLFVALAAWALYRTVHHDWIGAGVLAALAGLARPVGLAVCCALFVALLASLAREGRAGVPGRLIAACVIAPAGAAGYILWVAFQEGHPFGYFRVQAEWGNGFDAGAAFAGFIVRQLVSPPFIGGAGLLLGVGLVVYALRAAHRRGMPAPLLVYAAVITVLALGTSGYFGSKPRLLLPAFPLIVPAASYLAHLPRSRRYAILSVLVGASALYGAAWLNGSGPP